VLPAAAGGGVGACARSGVAGWRANVAAKRIAVATGRECRLRAEVKLRAKDPEIMVTFLFSGEVPGSGDMKRLDFLNLLRIYR
jgi:hypothetical protein